MHSKTYLHLHDGDDVFRVERLSITGTVSIGIGDGETTDPVTIFLADEKIARAFFDAARDALRLFGVPDVEPERCAAAPDLTDVEDLDDLDVRCELPVGHFGHHASETLRWA